MARPKADDPRSERVVARCTVSEKAAMEAGARDAGVSLSDYARASMLGADARRVQATLLAKAQAEANEVRERRVVSTEKAIKVLDVGPSFRCPLAPSRCSFAAPSAAARCPVHGRAVVAS